jgi:hypothetical protein
MFSRFVRFCDVARHLSFNSGQMTLQYLKRNTRRVLSECFSKIGLSQFGEFKLTEIIHGRMRVHI